MDTEMKFSDPVEMDEIVDQIKNAQTIGSIYEIANNVFPSWIIGFVPHYCPNYPHLEQNWHYICKQNGFRPSQIVIVNYLSDDKHHKLMNMFLDIFYRAGFVVRLVDHYSICQGCNQFAIPTKFIYDMFVDRNISVPSRWTSICKECDN